MSSLSSDSHNPPARSPTRGGRFTRSVAPALGGWCTNGAPPALARWPAFWGVGHCLCVLRPARAFYTFCTSCSCVLCPARASCSCVPRSGRVLYAFLMCGYVVHKNAPRLSPRGVFSVVYLSSSSLAFSTPAKHTREHTCSSLCSYASFTYSQRSHTEHFTMYSNAAQSFSISSAYFSIAFHT